jgi:hypothetical protein
MSKIIVGWWGSIEMSPTAGDKLAVDAVVNALSTTITEIHVSSLTPYKHNKALTIPWQKTVATDYALFVFVCGPLVFSSKSLCKMLRHYNSCKRVAIGVSIINVNDPLLTEYFDGIIPRDMSGPHSKYKETFDVALAALSPLPHVSQRIPQSDKIKIGCVLRGNQSEYGERCWFQKAVELMHTLSTLPNVEIKQFDTVLIPKLKYDTQRVLDNFSNLDLVITTRMHGLLLSLSMGIPVIAMDQIEGGKKVTNISNKIEWDWCYSVKDINLSDITQCLSQVFEADTRSKVEKSRALAMSLSQDALKIFLDYVSKIN